MVPVDDTRGRRATWSGFSDALAKAVELVGTTVLFLLFGRWLDGRFGTTPLLTVIFTVFAVTGLGIVEFYRYKDNIRREEEGKPWTRTTK